MERKNTPFGVILIGIFFILFGLITCLGVILWVTVPAYLFSWLGVVGIIVLIVGIVEIIFGIGCLLAWPRVWIMGVVILICGILVQVDILISWLPDYGLDLKINFWIYFGLVLTGTILYYFIQPEVKEYFGRV